MHKRSLTPYPRGRVLINAHANVDIVVGYGLWVREARAGSYMDVVWHAGVHCARDHTQQGD